MSAYLTTAASSNGSISGYYGQDKEAGYYQSGNGQEIKGEWHGAGLEHYGIKDGDTVQGKELDNIAAGYDKNGINAELYNAGRDDRRQAYDLTVSFDKSLSITGYVAGKDTADKIQAAMDYANKAAMDYTEKNFAVARVTNGNDTQRINAENLTYAVYQHKFSRNEDAQTHFHNVIANTVNYNGKQYSLSNEDMIKNQSTINAVAQNALAYKLKESGIGYEIDKKGNVAIAGITQELKDANSTRNQEIAEKVKEYNRTGKYQDLSERDRNNKAWLETRKDKDLSKSEADIIKEIKAKSEPLFNKAEFDKAQAEALSIKKMDIDTAIKAAINDLTDKQAVVFKKDLIATVIKYAPGQADIKTIENKIKDSDYVIKLKDKENGNIAYSTQIMINTEKTLDNIFKEKGGSRQVIADKEFIDKHLQRFENKQGFTLSKEQKDAIHSVLENKDGITNIQGNAGTGKTTILEAIKTVTDAKGYTLTAISYQGKAADEMAKSLKDNNIKSYTIDSFNNDKKLELNDKSIVIMDESSMTGAKDMLKITEKIKESGAKLIMIGDFKQLQAVRAGIAFLQSQEHLTTAEITESLRQRDNKEYQNAVQKFAEGNTDKAFDLMGDKLEQISNIDMRRNAVLEQYRKFGKDTAIVTDTNANKDFYNNSIRTEKIKNGEITKSKEFTVSIDKNLDIQDVRQAKSYDIGDKIFLKENAIGLGKAGAEFTVKGINKENNELILESISKTEWQGHNTGKFVHQGSSFVKILDKVHTKNERYEFKSERSKNTMITEQKNIKNDTIRMFGFSKTVTTVDKTIKIQHTLDLNNTDLVNKIGGVSKETKKNFGIGDKIMLTKNDKMFKVKNGQIAEILNIKNDKMTLKMESGDIKRIDINKYNHIDHAYALTVNKSQGMTVKNIIADLRSDIANFNKVYVGFTRGKNDYAIFTNNIKQLEENSKLMQEKTSTLDYEKVVDINRDNDKSFGLNYEKAVDTDKDNDKSFDADISR
jgi:conjugative relaxase-like TrwC/TraI family protein